MNLSALHQTSQQFRNSKLSLLIYALFLGISCLLMPHPSNASPAFTISVNGASTNGSFAFGLDFIPNNDFLVDSLGYYDDGADGFISNHPVALYDLLGNQLVTTTVTTNSPLTSNFRYNSIPPVYLRKGQLYRVVGLSLLDKYSTGYASYSFDPAISVSNTNWRYTSSLSNDIGANNNGWLPGYFGPNFSIKPNILIGEYHLDEANWSTTAGDVKDSSGNNLHGTANGTPVPTATSSIPARSGSTGTCGYADITGTGQITINNLPVNTTAGYSTSISFWMYWKGGTDNTVIGWQSLSILLSNNFLGLNTGNGDVYGTGSSGLANSWHHIVMVIVNGNVQASLMYIDGVQRSTMQLPPTTPNNAYAYVQPTMLISGPNSYSSLYRFNGLIDEVKVYNGILGQADVTALYNETHPCPVISIPTPLAEYRMDESAWAGTAGEVGDSSGNNYNGKAVNSLSTTSSGKVCGAGSFNGSSHFVSIPDSPNLRLTGNFTLAAWIKTTSSAANDIISKVSPTSPYGGYEFDLGYGTAGKPALQSGGWRYSTGTSQINDGAWHHVAVQVNGTSIQYFVDGAAYGTAITFNGASSTYTGNLVLGAAVDVTGGRYFNGLMDEVKLWNTSLSNQQIAIVYSNEAAGNNYDGSTRNCGLIGQYHFEDSIWNSTSGEVMDSSGTGHPGTAYGAPLPSPKTANPARASVTGTCGYAETTGPSVGGGRFSFSNLPISTANNAQTSVAFWMYWDGSASDTVAIGWNTYDLLFSRGSFGFNTLNADVYGTSASSLANSWHHIVAVFTNGNVTSNKLYIDGVQQTLTQIFSTPIATSAMVQSTMYVSGVGTLPDYRFTGRIDEVNVFSYAVTAAEVTNLYNQTHVCPANMGARAANFNCVESGATASTGHLYTKLSDASLTFDVVALRADGTTVESDFATSYGQSINKAVTLELVDGAGNSTCSSRVALSPAVSQSITFTKADAGRKTVSLSALGKAYKDLRCRVTDSTQAPNKIGCSTDDFVVRPSSFALSGSATADLTGTSTTATPALKTNTSFTLAAASNVVGYDGTPKVDNALVQAHAGATQAGQISGSFSAASNLTGSASGTSFSYTEVGYFRLGVYGVYDDNFASVDSAASDCSNDFSNTPVNGKIGCKFGNTSTSTYFGRFIPDHLTASLGSHGGFAHACTGTAFSYNGQAIAYAAGNRPTLSLSAYNASNVLTRNYTGGFARLTPAQFTMTTPTTDASQQGKDNLNKLLLSRAAGTPSLIDNTGGNLSYQLGADIYTYQREANALINKFTNRINLTFTAIADLDGVTTTNLPFSLSPSGEEIRYGRILLKNALGSELLDLPMPMVAEYYNGSSFVTSTDDTCSVATLSITDPDNTDSITPANTCFWDTGNKSGSAACATSAPSGKSYQEGASLTNGNFNVVLKAPNANGSLSITAAVDNWMTFNWSGTGNSNPSARASFGLYRGNPKIIYMREVY